MDKADVSECLGGLEYEAVAPAIAMAAVVLIWLVDFFAARWVSPRQDLDVGDCGSEADHHTDGES
jgi:zinc transporter 1/2/3